MAIAKRYLLYGLEASPLVVRKLMRSASAEILDRRPDPARFSLREVLAHLADWEGIWYERLEQLLSEDAPQIQGRNPDDVAALRDCGTTGIEESLAQFARGRAAFVQRLSSLSDSDWHRAGVHSEAGQYSIHDLAQFALGHDGYHLKQIVEWIDWE